MRWKEYTLIDRAVSEGVAYGVARAYKHTDRPPPDALIETIEREVMSALCEILDLSDGEVPA